MKKIFIAIVVLAALVALFFAFNSYIYDQKQGEQTPALSYKDATYTIAGERVTLVSGMSEVESVPGSASKTITKYFGNEVTLDLDLDGTEDTVFLLTQETGGSGTFFYVVAALNTKDGYIGSQGLLLGDRIAPQTTEVSMNPAHRSVVVVNYAVRAPGEPFTERPSIGKSIWLKLDPETLQFGEVVQNFEGEADPSRMSLTMKPWTWVSALYNDGRELKPGTTKPFTITFGIDGRFSATTDCNSVAGDYSADASNLTFSKMISTLMFCEGSLESDFTKLLETTSTYHFTSKGELIFDLKFDSGNAVFR